MQDGNAGTLTDMLVLLDLYSRHLSGSELKLAIFLMAQRKIGETGLESGERDLIATTFDIGRRQIDHILQRLTQRGVLLTWRAGRRRCHSLNPSWRAEEQAFRREEPPR